MWFQHANPVLPVPRVKGLLLQGGDHSSVNRGTHKFAIKCSAAVINGTLVDIYKYPKQIPANVLSEGAWI